MNRFRAVVLPVIAMLLAAFVHREGAFLGISVDAAKSGDGILITAVTDGSPAAKVGLRKDDIILEIDGKPVKTPQELRDLLKTKSAGDDVMFAVRRGSERFDKIVKLGAREEPKPPATAEPDFKERMAKCESDFAERIKSATEQEAEGLRRLKELAESATVRVKPCAHPACSISSGFITGGGKYLVTAGHVMGNKHRDGKIYLLLADGRRFAAEPVKWTHSDKVVYGKTGDPDLAVCRILNPKGEKLPSVELAAAVNRNDVVVMAGFPRGWGKTRKGALAVEKDSANDILPILNYGKVDKTTDLHLGFVSACGVTAFQGNSGGPFYTLDGKAAGILTNSNFKTWSWGTQVDVIRRYLAEAEKSGELPKKE